jgi:hypothetical protein
MMTDLPDFYYMQDAHIDFAAFDENGPMDLTGGRVVVAFERTGRKPFFLQVDTQNALLTQWKDQTQGTGIITIPLSLHPELPIGHMKLQLVAITQAGKEEFQYLSWIIVNRTIAIT